MAMSLLPWWYTTTTPVISVPFTHIWWVIFHISWLFILRLHLFFGRFIQTLFKRPLALKQRNVSFNVTYSSICLTKTYNFLRNEHNHTSEDISHACSSITIQFIYYHLQQSLRRRLSYTKRFMVTLHAIPLPTKAKNWPHPMLLLWLFSDVIYTSVSPSINNPVKLFRLTIFQ